jgi:hypothetical protein
MSKRLSSLFSLSKDSGSATEADVNAHSRDSSASFANPPTNHKVHKHTSTLSIEMPSVYDRPPPPALTPLTPPPLLGFHGSFRPPSSAGTESRPGSGASSPQSGPRSRPQTPNIVVAQLDGNNSPRPLTPTSGKLNKKKSWLPGKSDKQKDEEKKKAKAWIAGLRDFVNYDITPILNGEKVSTSYSLRATLTDSSRCLKYGTTKATHSSTSILEPQAKVPHSRFTRRSSMSLHI